MKKFLFKSTLAVLGAATLFFSCQQNNTTEEKPEVTKEQLAVQLDSLEIGMIEAWDSMLRSDDLKMQYIKRYISEIEFIPGQQAAKIEELRAMYDVVKEIKYDRFNWTSDGIDDFDAKQTALIQKLFEVGASTPGIDSYPLEAELRSDISTMDQLNLIKERSNYDNFAVPYNCLLSNEAAKIQALGGKYVNMKKVATFMIAVDCELALNPPEEILEEITDSLDEEYL